MRSLTERTGSVASSVTMDGRGVNTSAAELENESTSPLFFEMAAFASTAMLSSVRRTATLSRSLGSVRNASWLKDPSTKYL